MGEVVETLFKPITEPPKQAFNLLEKGVDALIPKPEIPAVPGAAPIPVPGFVQGEGAAGATQESLDEARASQRNTRRGRASTILTGPRGVTEQTGTLSSRTLLGA